MAEKAPKGLFWRVPEYTKSTSTKIEYRETSDWMGKCRREKFEIITTTTWRHNGDERYVVFKTEERERKMKLTRDDLKHFESGNYIRIEKHHHLSEKEQLVRAKFVVDRPKMI